MNILQENLFNKKDVITTSDKRWSMENMPPDMSKYLGIIDNVDKFDASFFGMNAKIAANLDPMTRILLEKTFEAIIDAGMSPEEIKGTRTGVFVGASESESEIHTLLRPGDIHTLTGNMKCMTAHRLSYWLEVSGPSYMMDSACSSTGYALDHAYRSIRNGQCDMAIVAGAHLNLHPFLTLSFSRLGVSNKDGKLKAFDGNANGYTRSEAIVVVFLQKSKDARRIYSQVVHVKSNCDGWKEQGITYPSTDMQQVLLKDFYNECDIDPAQISYVEAHGTGTRMGDPQEIITLDSIFTKGRTTPLLIGSVKANIGHSEPVANLCSIAKVIIAMESGFIPPNIYFNKPKKGDGIDAGRMKVVTEITKWNVEIAALDSFGFGGANCHTVLKANTKTKTNSNITKSDLPKLIYVSGRTPEAIDCLINNIETKPIDPEYVRLLHESFKYNIPGHLYRGYIVLSNKYKTKEKQLYNGDLKSITFVFNGIETQWAGMGLDLMKIPVFANIIHKCNTILAHLGINVVDIISNKNPHCNDIINLNIGITAVQLGLINILNSVQIKPDYIIGYSSGRIACAYFDGCLTLEQAIKASYYTGFAHQHQQQDVLKKYLEEIVPLQTNFSTKLINSSTNRNSTKLIDYLLHNGFQPEEFKETLPKQTIIIELLSSEHLQNSFREKIIDDMDIVSLIKNSAPNDQYIMLAIGKLYLLGCNPRVENLYPPISFPVSRGTDMISPYIKWDHSKSWYVFGSNTKLTNQTYSLSLNIPVSTEMKYVVGHNIDGRILYPATGYIMCIWEAIATFTFTLYRDLCVVFEDIQFIRAVNIPSNATLINLNVMIQRVSGKFEILEEDQIVVKGTLKVLSVSDIQNEMTDLPVPFSEKNNQYVNLTEADIYKELRIRGYYYSGMFRAIQSADITGTIGEIKWEDNYITFMDNMLQMKLLTVDTRGLYVPTKIRKLIINPFKHKECAEQLRENNKNVPVHVYKNLDIIKSGGIEIQGLRVSAISRKKPAREPVLETYKFVPNITDELSLEKSTRVVVQLLLENFLKNKIKVVELIEETSINEAVPYLCPMIKSALNDLPLIQAELNILSNKYIKPMSGIVVSDTKLSLCTECLLVVATNSLDRSQLLENCLNILIEGGFVLTRETLNVDLKDKLPKDVEVILMHKIDNEYIILLRKMKAIKLKTAVNVTSDTKRFTWLPVLQRAIKSDPNTIVYSQGEDFSGILGLANCIRKEPNTEKVKCVFIMDKNARIFDLQDEFYIDQLQKGLGINVLKNGKWGTYRHLVLEEPKLVKLKHAYVGSKVLGDISSLNWMEGHLSNASNSLQSHETLVHIYYSALNFRDVMIAFGRIAPEVFTQDRIQQACLQGIEFSGKLSNGKRVMGILPCQGIANMVMVEPDFLIDVPDSWSLQDAATVPIVYMTVLYAFVCLGHIRPRQTILIHAGSGGIGQAAINVALFYECTVYVTIGSQEKRDFIKSTWPQIKDNQIGNSRDMSFENWIMAETNGRGVDIVINSLAEEMLQASVRCLADYGKFLEIGKFDMMKDNPVSLMFLKKKASYHGVVLEAFFEATNENKKIIKAILTKSIEQGAVKPLSRTVAKKHEVISMLRYMAAGKHIGKVLIEIRSEEPKVETKPTSLFVPAIARHIPNPDKSYIILGGLGGFGLEITDWLVLRNARNIVLVSRKGITTGYQSMRIKTWRSYGVNVLISTENISTYEGCNKIIKQATKLGPVEGIFNLAVVLKDAVLENQTEQNFETSFSSKAVATKLLDIISRKSCPDLKLFVIFTSVSCGRGNAGQTNYGMANSIMERICEQRKLDGFPALAIQWGAVGDVGILAEMQKDDQELVISGTLQQKIGSCISLLDRFVKQSDPIVSSIIVAEKKSYSGDGEGIVDAICRVLGIQDCKTISPHTKLLELGMDSITSNEIKQILERNFNIFLTVQKMRSLTFINLQELESSMKSKSLQATTNQNIYLAKELQYLKTKLEDVSFVKEPFVILNSCQADCERKIFILPGIEGMALSLKPLAENLKLTAIGLQLNDEDIPDNIQEMAITLLETITSQMGNQKEYILIAHSWGTLIAIELASQLETKGCSGNIIFLDGSVDVVKTLTGKLFENKTESEFQNEYLNYLLYLYMDGDNALESKAEYENCATWEEKVLKLIGIISKVEQNSQKYLENICTTVFKKLKAVLSYKPNLPKLKSKITLIKPQTATYIQPDEDYGISAFVESPVNVITIEGDHITIIENKETANIINSIISPIGNEELEK